MYGLQTDYKNPPGGFHKVMRCFGGGVVGLGYSADKSFHGACVLVVAFLAVVCLSTL